MRHRAIADDSARSPLLMLQMMPLRRRHAADASRYATPPPFSPPRFSPAFQFISPLLMIALVTIDAASAFILMPLRHFHCLLFAFRHA